VVGICVLDGEEVRRIVGVLVAGLIVGLKVGRQNWGEVKVMVYTQVGNSTAIPLS